MTRAEKIKIRAERVAKRRERQGLTTNTTSTVTTALIKAEPIIVSHELPAIIPEGKLTIEICIHCNFYQRRLNWMLNSLLDQKGDIPNIIVNISHTDLDGNPTTQRVCEFFREKGLNIVETLVTQEEVSNRAVARNKQATATTADWILFADSDVVYSDDFFFDLQNKLKTIYKDIKVVMGADRYSLDIPFCTKYFNEQDTTEYPRIIENVSKIVSEFPIKWCRGADSAPGNFQLISVQVLKEKCGGKITDRPKDHWRNTKGDRALRCRAGGRIGIKVQKMWHLNHDRSGPGVQR